VPLPSIEPDILRAGPQSGIHHKAGARDHACTRFIPGAPCQ
jgi:hypothetical protein